MTGAFVGRAPQLATLEQALAEARGGVGRLVLLTGEAGIGKTRLSDELCRRAEAQGCRIAWGRSWEGEGTPAYWPWTQVLRRLGLATLEAQALGDPTQARFRLFDSVTQGLRQAAQATPLVLVLDDLHAADVSSLLLLQFVARNLRGERVLLVATSRDLSSAASEETRALMAKIGREALLVPLGRLEREDLATWVADAAARHLDKLDSLFVTSEGNPLFVEELLAAWKKAPTALTSAPLPLGIRAAIRAHLALLSERTQWLLEAAAVLGREFSKATLLETARQSAEACQPLLDEAILSGVLGDAGEGQLRFAHVLLRDELYAHIGQARRDELHRATARVLAPRPAHRGEAAHHFVLGARAEDGPEAGAVVLAAMRDGLRDLAFEDVARLGERALAALTLPPREEIELWISLGEARILGGRTGPGKEACLKAAALATALRSCELFVRAALTAATELTFRRDEENVELLRRALAQLPKEDSPTRAHVMARLAAAMVPPGPGEFEELLQLRAESNAMARRVGHEATLFGVLRLSATTYPESHPAAERLAVNAEAIQLAVRLGQVPRVVSLFGFQVACWLELGDLDAALREAANAERLLADFRAPHYQWRAPLIHAMLACLEGRFAEAESTARALFLRCREHEVLEGAMVVGVFLMTLPYVSGDLGRHAEIEDTLLAILPSAPVAALFRSISDAAMGRTARVQQALAMARTLPTDVIPGPAGLALACIRAGLVEHAGFFYGLVQARAGALPMLFGPGGTTLVGPTDLLLGQLAAMMGRAEVAIAHLSAAVAFARKIRASPFEAQAELAWAEVLVGQLPSEASTHAERARALAEPLGMKTVAARAAALCAGSGKRFIPSGVEGSEERPRTPAQLSVIRDGEQWVVASGSSRVVVRDGKGLGYLEALVQQPHREIHVLELIGAEDEGDGGPLLDARAKSAYRERAESLRDELEEAVRNADVGRAERMREELDALASELTRAVGLGGRNRRASSTSERARINVQRRLRDVIRRVAEQEPRLGQHLELSVRTGRFCIYAPTWPGEGPASRPRSK